MSKVGTRRSGNIKAIGAYARTAMEGARPMAWSEEPTPLQRLAETWWLGLRTRAGLSAAQARERAACTVDDSSFAAEARALHEHGLLDLQQDVWTLAPKGLPLADAVAKRFLALAD